jgi:hypothetical protein
MTNMAKSVRSVLQAGILGGAVALLPTVALGGDGPERNGTATAEQVDHLMVEARGAGAVTAPATEQTTLAVPDHETAEARGVAPAVGAVGAETTAGVSDHASAEARRAGGQPGR